MARVYESKVDTSNMSVWDQVQMYGGFAGTFVWYT
jgi:hypothetical protein